MRSPNPDSSVKSKLVRVRARELCMLKSNLNVSLAPTEKSTISEILTVKMLLSGVMVKYRGDDLSDILVMMTRL